MASNQRCAIAPSSPLCSCIQTSIAGSRFTELGNLRNLLITPAIACRRRMLGTIQSSDSGCASVMSRSRLGDQFDPHGGNRRAVTLALHAPAVLADLGIVNDEQALAVTPKIHSHFGKARESALHLRQ